MKKICRFRYILPFLYFCIALLDWTELDVAWNIDDKNLLIFFTSPPFLFINDINSAFHYMVLIYLISLLVWFGMGYLIDIVISKIADLIRSMK